MKPSVSRLFDVYIIFTKTADRAFYGIASFLEENASELAAQKFAEKVDATIEKLRG